MEDDWNKRVKITFPDGRERSIPLPSWNDELAERVEAAGGRVELPQDPPPPKVSDFFLVSPQGEDDDEETPEGIKELLLDIEEDDLTEKERGFLATVKEWRGPLTPRQLLWATNIVRKHRRRR